MSDFSGFIKNSDWAKSKHNTEQDFMQACFELLAGNTAQAFLRFSAFPVNDAAAAFNRALCLYKSKCYKKSLMELDLSMKNISAVSSSSFSVPSEVEQTEEKNDGYLFPMQRDMPMVYAKYARNTVLRLRADILFVLDDRYALNVLFSQLNGTKYANIEEIKQKINFKEGPKWNSGK